MSFKQYYQTIRNWVITLVLSGRCRGYSPSTVLTTFYLQRLCRKHRYEPVEAFRLGLFNTSFDISSLNKFLSRKNITHLQESLNPPTMAPLFKNKANFYRRCMTKGLPVPRSYGLFSYPGRTIHVFCDGTLRPVTDKNAFLSSLPQRFVIKPVDKSLGYGFRIMTRASNGFTDHNGTFYDRTKFLSLLAKTSQVGMLMQELVENHPDITSFSGITGLQTIRVITLVRADNQVEILLAFFKTITSPKIVIDTFIDNLTGNLEITITPENGRLDEACYLDGTGKGIIFVDNHPVTGKPFKGFEIPYWAQVCDLARNAAMAFLPVRTIGWDIAVTAQGPCLIEGNIWWNPPNQHRAMDKISKRMNAVIAELANPPV